MSMQEAIKNFSEQFSYQPEIQNKEKLLNYQWCILVGMGGSHLAADILKIYNPSVHMTIHEDYGLPYPAEMLKNSLVIASSYSGNTEEVIDAYKKAKEQGIALAAVSVGGKLIEMAKEDGIPYIQLPDTGIQPRSALGFSLKALMALMKEDKGLEELNMISDINPEDFEEEGKSIAKSLQGKVPVIYSSEINKPIAYNWKIKFNETGKIPAFCNAFPELNHNEMTGFDVVDSTKKLSENMCFIFLRDELDNPRIKKRMQVMKKLFEDRKLQEAFSYLHSFLYSWII